MQQEADKKTRGLETKILELEDRIVQLYEPMAEIPKNASEIQDIYSALLKKVLHFFLIHHLKG